MFNVFRKRVSDLDIAREEQTLRAYESSLGKHEPATPSDAYFAMLPQRIMACISREQARGVQKSRVFWLKPVMAMGTVVCASAAFVMLNGSPLTLDQSLQSLSQDDMQTMQVMADNYTPVAAVETPIESANNEAMKAVGTENLNEALTINDVTPEQANEEVDDPAPLGIPLEDQITIESLNEQEANSVIQDMKMAK